MSRRKKSRTTKPLDDLTVPITRILPRTSGWLTLPLYFRREQATESHDFARSVQNYVLASEIIAIMPYKNPVQPERDCARFALRNTTVGYVDMSADALLALVIRETR